MSTSSGRVPNGVERCRPRHLFRLAVKPGLTGRPRSVRPRRLTFEERLAVELPITSSSLTRDLRILALTVTSVFHGRGAY